jgi:hypothetical protein
VGNKMKHYINTNNQIFAFDDDQLHLVTADMREISNQELAELLAPTPEQLAEQAKAEAQAYLLSTDWYYARLAETGQAVPDDVIAKRKASRELLQ